MTALKFIAAMFVVAGIVAGLFDLVYEPERIVTERSPERLWWLPSYLGWAITSVASILYIVLDLRAIYARKSTKHERY